MPFVWWTLPAGFCAAALVNYAADRLNPTGLRRGPARRRLVWLGAPALFVALAGRDPDGVWTAGFAAVLLLIAVVDWEQRRAPNVIVLPATALALAQAAATGRLASAAAGAALAFAVFLALYALGWWLFGPGALGMGDVKLAALIGGVVGLEHMPAALLSGVLLAGIAATVLLLTGRARRGDTIPFGHFMALAALAGLIVWAG